MLCCASVTPTPASLPPSFSTLLYTALQLINSSFYDRWRLAINPSNIKKEIKKEQRKRQRRRYLLRSSIVIVSLPFPAACTEFGRSRPPEKEACDEKEDGLLLLFLAGARFLLRAILLLFNRSFYGFDGLQAIWHDWRFQVPLPSHILLYYPLWYSTFISRLHVVLLVPLIRTQIIPQQPWIDLITSSLHFRISLDPFLIIQYKVQQRRRRQRQRWWWW